MADGGERVNREPCLDIGTWHAVDPTSDTQGALASRVIFLVAACSRSECAGKAVPSRLAERENPGKLLCELRVTKSLL
ncbi:hypothetical protein [Bradyrhizobium sp. USDA 10063]